jgi:subtilisin
MKHALAALALALLIGAVFFLTHEKKAQFFEVDRSKTETGRWIVYNKKELFAKPGQKSFAMAGSEKLSGLNAFVFDSEPQSMLMATMATMAGEDWVIQKELIHHVFSGAQPVAAKCYRSNGPLTEISCDGVGPTPTPGPSPSPGPGPAPIPVEPAKSWGVTRVKASEAKALVDTSGVKICVVDTGIDLQHPQNGDVIGSIGFAGAVQDRQGHGTHVAGTIAGRGGVGVSRAKLLVCKGLSDSGSGSSSALAQCLNWCGQQGAQIISNSWGSPQPDQMINQVITTLANRGVNVFIANGNDGGPVNWPAKLSGSVANVFAIAASDQSDRITSFSSRGPETKFISPGAAIVSNWPGGGTRALDGTSMATPHAAAICAFGIAKGKKPCVSAGGTVGGYPFADALESAR